MKRRISALAGLVRAGRAGFVIMALTCAVQVAVAQSGPNHDGYYIVTDSTRMADSIRMFELQSVQVTSTRAEARTPVAFSEIGRAEIEKVNNGVDLPFLLQATPSVVVTSDAGAGIGYTGVRIRGTDASRINVTTNGIPFNDAESHSVFWVNMPDFVASVDDIQIQRGVGTSTNGAGAFGGSVNLKTESLTPQPYATVSGTYGSYNTHRESVNVGTGLLGGHWAFNARLSNIGSDGYVDHAWTKLKSYFFQAGFYSGNTTIKFITFAGKEETYHAWNGLTRGEMDYYGRRHNTCGEIWSPVFGSDGKPVYDSDGELVTEYAGHYKNQTDNYTQSNYQILFTQRLSDRFSLNVNLHFTKGDGYYEEYKTARTLKEYGLLPFVPADPSREPYYDSDKGMVTKSDLIRRKMMDNWFGGGVFSLDYRSPRLQASLGGAANRYDGDHFGKVLWVQNYAADPSFRYDHEYYNNRGIKDDFNVYLKASWKAADRLYLYGDLQYRYIDYEIDGTNDNWDWNNGVMQPLAVDDDFNFFNPKGGVTYEFNDRLTAYASVAVAHKEPTRNNYTDAKAGDVPKSERLVDYEAGATFRSGIFAAGVNLYYMDYKNQLVLTGEVNEIGEALATNVKDSYRAGIEITAGAQILPSLRWDVNATLSRNKIKHYTDYTSDDNWEQVATYLGTTDIAYSPKVLLGSMITFNYKGFSAALQSNYVGKQYVTNSASAYVYEEGSDTEKLELEAYFVNNLRLDYTFRLPSTRSLTVGVTVNNLLNEKYSSNGYGWSELYGNGSGGYTRSNVMYYFPQAGTNVLASVMLRF